MTPTLKYRFKQVESCNMCGTPRERFRILGRRLNVPHGMDPTKKTGLSTTVMKCTECGLVFSSPLAVPDDINAHYERQPQHYWNDSYFVTSDNYFSGQINRLRLLSKMKIQKGAKALDIGAGIGKCMKALEKAGFDVWGIEPSEPFFKMAVEKTGISPQRMNRQTVEGAHFEGGGRFDFITFGATLEHLYDPCFALKKALGWLKPGGLIHLEVPSSAWLTNKIANIYYRLIGTDYAANLSPMHPPYHLYEFDLRSFRKNALINGYKVLYHEYYVCRTFMPKMLDFILKPAMKITNTGMQLCVWLAKD